MTIQKIEITKKSGESATAAMPVQWHDDELSKIWLAAKAVATATKSYGNSYTKYIENIHTYARRMLALSQSDDVDMAVLYRAIYADTAPADFSDLFSLAIETLYSIAADMDSYRREYAQQSEPYKNFDFWLYAQTISAVKHELYIHSRNENMISLDDETNDKVLVSLQVDFESGESENTPDRIRRSKVYLQANQNSVFYQWYTLKSHNMVLTRRAAADIIGCTYGKLQRAIDRAAKYVL